MLSKALQIASANAGDESLYVEDVFSTYLYTGTGGNITVSNEIDLLNEGGLVWVKKRNTSEQHWLIDTERGVNKNLASNLADAQTSTTTISNFYDNGFLVRANLSTLDATYASWTFRKAEKFFDVVTYTGNGGSFRGINHNLGSSPGFVVVKRTDSSGNWSCYHRSLGDNVPILLNSTAGSFSSSTQVRGADATLFAVGNDAAVNASGGTYVAYLFAHDAGGFGDAGDENVISCGSYNVVGGASISVDIGFEPQWILAKASTASSRWYIFDSMRGFLASNELSSSNSRWLAANLSDAEGTQPFNVTSTGFRDRGTFVADGTVIYIAIRRPMKTPESGTEVFMPSLQNKNTTGFPVDAFILKRLLGGDNNFYSRLTGGTRFLETNQTLAEQTSSDYGFDDMDGTKLDGWGTDFIFWNFRRASGFFDVVCYTGTGVARTVAHNLTVVPELMIVKCRSSAESNWKVYVSSQGAGAQLYLSLTNAVDSPTGTWNNTTPTSSSFSVGGGGLDVNNNGQTHVAYLFATLAGVSKVGSYTGNGSSQTINCGFTGGARFILIKRTNASGNWFVWDSARGIVAGNDPYLALNTTAAEVTTDDSVDVDSSGFIVNQVAATNVNVNAASYIFLAIA